jgi:His-Xaa-Ser system radical SAM maturase HxsC
MIPLVTRGKPWGVTKRLIGRAALTPIAQSIRSDYIRVVNDVFHDEDLGGYRAIVFQGALPEGLDIPAIHDCPSIHIAPNDVVSAEPSGNLRTLIRHSSRSNTLFATDRCNSLCIMCSQPPREVDDSKNADELIEIVRLIDSKIEELGITGGEPTLLGEGLIRVIESCKSQLPQTNLHLLSNGRRFADKSFAAALANIRHPRLMIGVPVYSDIDSQHDYVVQARGAFEDTVIGLQNLALHDVQVEIRVVIHRHTVQRLVALAEFIYRNFTFASHIAFMGLEITGFAKANFNELWVDPKSYTAQLRGAVEFLAQRGLQVSIYNHQLCSVPESLWSYCRASISDWKNDFPPECAPCDVRERCCGFFTWNLGFPLAREVSPVKIRQLV